MEERFDDRGVTQQGEHAAEIAGPVEEVRVPRRRVVGAGEPLLQERGAGGDDKERQPGHQEKDRQEPAAPGAGTAGQPLTAPAVIPATKYSTKKE